MGLNALSSKDLQIPYLVINHFKFNKFAIDKLHVATLTLKLIFCSYRVYPSNSNTSTSMVVAAAMHSSYDHTIHMCHVNPLMDLSIRGERGKLIT